MEILSTKYLQNCQFAVHRYQALKNLNISRGCIVEVGVLAGDLSSWILKNLDPSELHLIDLYNCADFPSKRRFKKSQHEQFVTDRFSKEIDLGTVMIKKGISWEIMSEYPDNYFDLIYIDAGHDYKSVSKDLSSCLTKLKTGGRIMMNDYIMYDHITHTKYGVVEATNEFCINNNWEFEYFAFHNNLFCDVVLRSMDKS